MNTAILFFALLGAPVHARDAALTQDCWQKRPISKHKLTLLGQQHQAKKIPGSGLGEIVPFETVQKDGYMKTACVKDYMFYHGDKFGDHKHAYEIKDVTNVSIVHYAAIIPKEDRKAMTPSVCFNFCRTVPDMLFFGITNGRECYCEAYYQAEASDSSSCDAVCEGQTTQMCGGKTKSTVWEMHMCQNTAEDMAKTEKDLETLRDEIEIEAENLTTLHEDGQAAADELQQVYGKIGDPTAADLFQAAKVRAGVLAERSATATAIHEKVKEVLEEYGPLAEADFSNYENARTAEKLIKKAQALLKEGKAAREVIARELELHRRIRGERGSQRLINASMLYYPAMYFVDKVYLTDQATCSGDLTGPPKFGLSVDACAYHCETQVGKCKAFSHYSSGGGICFTFSNLETLTHYSDCLGRREKDKPASFLQRVNPHDARWLSHVQEENAGKVVPFVWKTKSEDADPAAFLKSVEGLCTQTRDCGALIANATLPDCSLMDTYECRSISQSQITDRVDKDEEDNDVDVLRLEFRAQVPTGKRNSACKINPTPCDSCKMYNTCSGPWAETEPLKIKKGHVAAYTWRSSGRVDNYEVFVGLYSKTAGLIDYQFQRGRRQEWKTFELMSPETAEYYLVVRLASYDASGGGAVGADIEIKNVVERQAAAARTETTAMCVVKYSEFDGQNLNPDPKGKRVGTLKEVTKRCLRSGGALKA